MTKYQELPTKTGGSISDGVSLSRGRVQLSLALKDEVESLVPNLQNVHYFSNSPCNLVSLGLLNDSGIFNDNENEIL